MISDMYTIQFEDLDWILEAHHRLGKEDHTWLMVRWLRDHDVSALMSLMCIGYYLRHHKGALQQAKDYVRIQRSKEITLTHTTEGETNG